MASRRIVIFSGTTEGRSLSKRLAAELRDVDILVSVATEYGETVQGDTPGIAVQQGKMTRDEKIEILTGAAYCIDATHPYATGITQHIKEACEAAGTPYLRLLREESAVDADVVRVASAEEAAEFLKCREGNILLTTGAKELPKWKDAHPERIYARVLPLESSLKSAEEAGVPMANVIAMQGPFSRELNQAVMKEFNIQYMVTKDGGKAGGFEEKLQAARELEIKTILITRPEDKGIGEDEVYKLLKAELK